MADLSSWPLVRSRGRMKQEDGRGPSYTVPCDDYVHVVEFSPFDCGAAPSLLAYGGSQYVVVGTCLFQEEDTEVDGVEFTALRVFHHGVRVDALAWSPESRLDQLPQVIRFCTAAADRNLRLVTSDLQDTHEVKVMEGHTDYVNHLVFEPTEGKQIASVKPEAVQNTPPRYTAGPLRRPDSSPRRGNPISGRPAPLLRVIVTTLWDLDGNLTTSFLLRSPGMSVCWHPEEIFKLMVAEKSGVVRFYNLITQQALLSLDSGQSPLMSADWCLANTIKVGAVTGNDWVIWDITRSSYPQEKRPVHSSGGQGPMRIYSPPLGALEKSAASYWSTTLVTHSL
ncbi:hypothetical protein AAFF_G00077120 [Aldrovandia affinis]|uniref:Nucleoporin Nup37 n=1 Tax=Aldrovandia affinis TaxID=143900 RepID=A0AAD7RXT6_9TELE|nr:hypothetical protein AAFF_G00077120 [Aldrovandia affinis]